MAIYVVSDDQDVRESWTSLLTNINLFSMRVVGSDPKTLRTEDMAHNDLIVFIGDQFNGTTRTIVSQCLRQQLAVFCITEAMEEIVYTELVQNGMKGILNSKKASLDLIKTAMRIVIEGGFYLERPVCNA